MKRLIALAAALVVCQAGARASRRPRRPDPPSGCRAATAPPGCTSGRNSAYSPPRSERYTVTARAGTGFRVAWEEFRLRADESPANGFADFRHTDAGLINTNFQSTPAPPQFPVLCADRGALLATRSRARCSRCCGGRARPCWPSRSCRARPGTRVGGVDQRRDGRQPLPRRAWTSASRRSRRRSKAAKVESVITQAGALGDPFGSGLRTVWWVYGVGPVKVLFQHTRGEAELAQLQSHEPRSAAAARATRNLLPLALGAESPLPLAQLQAHEALVRAAAHGRGGVEQHGARQRARHLRARSTSTPATCSPTGSAG